MQLRTAPSSMHNQIGFYPGNENFDRFVDKKQKQLDDLYSALLKVGITPTHKVYIPWAIGFVDVTDPSTWDNDKIRCYWVSLYSYIDHCDRYDRLFISNSWKNPDAIIFEQIIDI